MRPHDSRRGFSLVELMVTVAMVGVLAVIAVPSVMEALQRREVVDAAQAAQDLLEFARVQAASRNRAYQVDVTPAAGPGAPGRMEVREGWSSACMDFASNVPGHQSVVVRTLDLGGTWGSSAGQQFASVVLFEVVPDDLPDAPLCFKPDGRVFQLQSDTTPIIIPASDDLAGGDARIRFQRINKGRREGPIHAVVVPFNGLTRQVIE